VKSLLRRRPSPALVISTIALFVSLSGVSYGVATGFIDSREIQNNEVRSLDIRNNEIRTRDLRNNEVRGIDIRNSTIQSRDIGLNQVTGLDVKEDTLQKVPSATAADTATSAGTAGTADSVGGVTLSKINYSGEANDAFTQVLSLRGLTLEARCVSPDDLEVRATTTVANSEITTNGSSPALSTTDFDPGDTPLVVNQVKGPVQIVVSGGDGSVVTVHASVLGDPNDVHGTTDDCGFFGVAQAG